MKYYLSVLLIIGVFFTSKACKCNLFSFQQELSLSNEIIVGQITEKNSNIYRIRVIKEWNGRVKVRESDTISIIQELNSCTKRVFELRKIYLFYIRDNSVHNCSRTIEFSKSRDIELLENEEHLRSIYYNSDSEFDSLNYIRKYIINEFYGKKVDIREKSVVYIYQDNLISKNEIPEDRNLFYPVRYFLIDNIEIENIDYIFYIDNSFQDKISKPKLSKKIIKKIKKEASREQ